MADETLIRIRAAAEAYAEAVRQTQRYFDRIDDTTDPSVLIEYAELVRTEEAALADRLDALTVAGLRAESFDGGSEN
ncbi:hypothetical protein AMIS_42970 [Actinoplanes missouriensis 431]|uniref:Uncharacterized protein n=1 Tax=Actinoplanes missouriensis (strain ATCC 14538 / DSM 43046 / CBS 188.64 / JCM 3121 / NBRC 102363 / NCIMB 12654 / NRRL B-3342 / UNCC 431) TaxID=512565 RepID=I0H930_ACTM4|nr:hypothetical protein [Actinoplanes missouriensis]BAL89517.1 hypothetical protein AMIS_42970 [Actinoplanes missouriensis 431]